MARAPRCSEHHSPQSRRPGHDAGAGARIVIPGAGVEIGAPPALSLARPFPDPSDGTTQVRFSLPEPGRVRFEILDLQGRRVRQAEGQLPGGTHTWGWAGDDSAGLRAGAGVYFVRLVTRWGTRTQRLVRLQ
jgi:flagellar hook assembly protein FlgD